MAIIIAIIGSSLILNINGVFEVFLLVIFLTLGIILIFIGLFREDEKLEFEKKKYKETMEEKRRKERLKKEETKIKQVYKLLKSYLSTEYLGEVKETFAYRIMAHPNIGNIRLMDIISKAEDESILLHNTEDNRFMTDIKDMFWSHTSKMQEHYNIAISKKSREEGEKEIARGLVELLPDVNELLDKIERKINDPLSIYGEDKKGSL